MINKDVFKKYINLQFKDIYRCCNIKEIESDRYYNLIVVKWDGWVLNAHNLKENDESIQFFEYNENIPEQYFIKTDFDEWIIESRNNKIESIL